MHGLIFLTEEQKDIFGAHTKVIGAHRMHGIHRNFNLTQRAQGAHTESTESTEFLPTISFVFSH